MVTSTRPIKRNCAASELLLRSGVVLLLLLVMCSLRLTAFQPGDTLRPKDARPDSTLPTRDSLALADSLEAEFLPTPLPYHGSLQMKGREADVVIDKRQLYGELYDGLFDILTQHSNSYPLSLGFTGQNNQLSYYGAAARDVQLNFNGRSLADPGYGAVNIEQYPPEFAERIELLFGSRAVIMEDNAAGALINLQEIRYNSKYPYTRIWYIQGGGDLIGSDGVFSQNVARGWNVTLGWRRLSADGQYRNNALDSWNVRALLRWNISERFNISLSDVFTNHQIDVNGGIDLSRSSDIGSSINAVPLFSNIDERVIRHDLTLTASGLLAADSSSGFTVSAYASNADWIFTERRFDGGSDNRVSEWGSHLLGLSGRFDQSFGGVNFLAGGTIEQRGAGANPWAAAEEGARLAGYGLLELAPAPTLKVSGGLRTALIREKLHLNTGARLNYSLGKAWRGMIDISQSVRLPSRSEGAELSSEDHLLGIAGIALETDEFALEVEAFARLVDNPILTDTLRNETGRIVASPAINGNSRRTLGAHLHASFSVLDFSIRPFAQLHFVSESDDASDERFPLIYGGIEVQREFAFGASRLRVGARVRGLSDFRGEQFIPYNWSYISSSVQSGARSTGIDLMATALLGNASVRFMFENVLSQTYYFVPIYPELDGNLRLSVAWTFLD